VQTVAGGEEQDVMRCCRRVGIKVKTVGVCLSITALLWLSLAVGVGDQLSRTAHGDDASPSSASRTSVVFTGLSVKLNQSISEFTNSESYRLALRGLTLSQGPPEPQGHE